MTGSDRTVVDVLSSAATRWPQRVALIDEQAEITYEELQEAAFQEAAALAEAGLAAGDRLLIMLPTSIRFVTVWLGSMVGGLVEVPVNTDYTGEMLRHIVADSGAWAIVTTREYAARLDELSDGTGLRLVLVVDAGQDEVRPGVRHLPAPAVRGVRSSVASVPQDPEMPIGILYTSGTTGPSKGAVISHHQAYLYAERVALLLDLREGDVYYGPLPLFHIAGQWAVVYACLLTGATAHIRGRFSLSAFWDDCVRSGANVTYLLGAMAQLVMRHAPVELPAHRLERMLMIPLVPDLEEARKRLGVRITTCYGSTEAGVPLAAGYDVQDPTVIGCSVPGYDLRVVDDAGDDVPDGVVGELLVRVDERARIFQGYFGNAEATKRAMADGWFHSGDLVRRDAQGVYHFVDRSKDALRRRGENISSFEVEREALAHPQVEECAAVGVPSRLTEDDLVVFVVASAAGPDFAAELGRYLRDRAPRFMWPDQVVVVSHIPKTPTGKTAKQELKESYLRSADRESEEVR